MQSVLLTVYQDTITFLFIGLQFYFKKYAAQILSGEFGEIFRKCFLLKHLRAAASEFFTVAAMKEFPIFSWKIFAKVKSSSIFQ